MLLEKTYITAWKLFNNSNNTNNCLMKYVKIVIFIPLDHVHFIVIYSKRCFHRNKKE